jgi:hypothetical protein
MEHIHTVSRAGLKSIAEEHEAWAQSTEPCIFCGVSQVAPLAALRRAVTGKIMLGEAEAITEQRKTSR